MRLIVKMTISKAKRNDRILETSKLTPKQQKHIEITNRLKKDGYKVLPISIEEFLR